MIEAIAIVALFVLLSRSGSASEGSDKNTGPHTKGGGTVWGEKRWSSSSEARGFAWDTNAVFIDPECRFVFEGEFFFPANWASVDTWAEEADTVEATLAIRPENTVIGYIDYVADTLGVTDPLEVTRRIFAEIAPSCDSVPDSEWSPGLRAWYTSLAGRVAAYINQETIG